MIRHVEYDGKTQKFDIVHQDLVTITLLILEPAGGLHFVGLKEASGYQA